MIGFIKNFLRNRSSTDQPPPQKGLHRSGFVRKPRRKPPGDRHESKNEEYTPDFNSDDPEEHIHIESTGPGKNVLVRKKYVREETGTHDKLKIVDDSIVDTGEATGLDPYNSGQFDRSKNWDQRFRK